LVAVWNEDDKAACARYNALTEEAEEHAAQLRTLTDHHYISVLKNKKGTLTLKAVKDRLAATEDSAERRTLQSYLDADEGRKAKTKKAAALLAKVKAQYMERLKADPLPEALVDLDATVRYLMLLDEQSDLKSEIKTAETEIDAKACAKYPELSVGEIKTLVVDDKWLAALAKSVRGEIDRVSQALTGRIRQLAERYTTPLPELTAQVKNLEAKVSGHLAKMGFEL